MATPKIGTSRTSWFVRGMLMGIMFIAALNAISFFVRTQGWGSLLGQLSPDEAIGFPLEMWRHGEQYNGKFVDIIGLLGNVGIGLLLGTVCGLATITQVTWLNQMIADFESESGSHEYQPFQFSLGNLMIATIPIAVLFAAARTGRAEVLGAIYIFGPLSLIALAMLPRGLSWDWRVIILTPMAISLIAFAIWIGIQLKIDFDKVLMGIYVCWVPQSAIGAIALTLGILFKERQRLLPSA